MALSVLTLRGSFGLGLALVELRASPWRGSSRNGIGLEWLDTFGNSQNKHVGGRSRDSDLAIVPTVDTWLKRSCQMSGELQPFELIYVPRGVPIYLSKRAHLVDEDWERVRHQHVHLHRKVTLASAPVTVKQEGYDILMGQRAAALTVVSGKMSTKKWYFVKAMSMPTFRLLSGKERALFFLQSGLEIPIRTKPGDARVGDVRRLLADTLQLPHGRLQLLGGAACLEDALWIAALGLEDIHVCILPDMLENRLAKYAGVSSFDELQDCSELIISHKGLKVLPERFGLVCSSLKSLHLTSLQLRSLPDSLGLLSSLERLVIMHCNISDLPPSFVDLRGLGECTISKCQLASLPKDLHCLQRLRLFELGANKLHHLPDSIGGLQNLEILDLDSNQIAELPAAAAPQLQVLGVSQNLLRSFDAAALTRLEEVRLSGNRLSKLPPGFCELSCLKELQCHANPLRPLPEDFGQLRSLQRLQAAGCLLETLPSSFGDLVHLEFCDVARNRLRNFPEDLGRLRSLKELMANGNRLQYLPDSFGDLTSLCTCLLNANELIELPESFGQLESLEELSVAENQLETLPASFEKLGSLRKVQLSRNRLTYIPAAIWQLPNLVDVEVLGNSTGLE
eukprot:s475_g34.t1